MDTSQALALLGGLTPQQFMRRHWQKKPLLVRQALPGFRPLLSRSELFSLAGREQVESRLVVQGAAGWRMRSGPFGPRSLPPLSKPGWSLLVQGADLHNAQAHALLQRFRFLPDARLDDLMISYASLGGGVGPHFDSYDVFLLQASGRRRWRIGKQTDLTLQKGVPLKILQNFEPSQEFVLEAGDMLYLPPRYAHDGVSEESLDTNGKPQACMTYSIGFRAPGEAELAGALLQRLGDYVSDEPDGDFARSAKLYRDPLQSATANPAAVPPQLLAFAQQAVTAALQDPLAIACALGEYLTEPKSSVWFDGSLARGKLPKLVESGGLALEGRTRMLYDEHHVFINGESYRARGADASLMRSLADRRGLTPSQWRNASPAARSLLTEWLEAGWVTCA